MAKKELSAMMRHWVTVKEKYKNCIVFYRLGDFYEMFFDDAVKASKILDLTLTGRDCGLDERAPMCGVPHHAVDSYIQKLVASGEKVAICEQTEDPATAKGIVRREVVRVVTAGTLDADSIDEKTNNFICCAYKNGEKVALCWADITTGELTATVFSGAEAVKNCVAQMVKLDVKEIIVNDEILFILKDFNEFKVGILPKFSSYPEWAFGFAAAERRLLEQFNAKSLSAYPVSGNKDAVCAAGALLEYLKETQMRALKNIDGIKYLSSDKYLQLDSAAVRNLEIMKTLGSGSKFGSLYWLLDKTKTPMGARYLQSVLTYPLHNTDKINYRLDGVQELFESTVVRLKITELLKEIKDVERIAGSVAKGDVKPRECLALASSLAVIPNIKFTLAGFSSRIISDICGQLYDLTDVAELLQSAISKDAPQSVKDGGVISDGFNERLDELRNIRTNAKDVILEMEIRERENTGIRGLKIKYNRIFGYYIEVTNSFIDKVPINYQRRQTVANAERFITQELKQLEDKILSSEDMAIKLESEIYDKIKEKLLENIDKFKSIATGIAALDLLVSFAEVSKTNRYVRPKITESGKAMQIIEGRHPVVEIISKDRFIPNDTVLDENENRTMIITGPNMAGKSTFMRQTAIIAIMAHLGCFVPAKSAQIPLIDRVFTRVGASDNLISDQSTFMVEMIEVATIIHNATKDSLLILDEVGRGTSTYDGLSIAWAVIEHLTEKIGAKTMFATHYHELTELENKIDGVKNYKIAVKELNGSIVFLRKIMRGGANRSFGIEVASLAGIPAEVTERAKRILKSVEKGDKIIEADNNQSEDIKEKSEIDMILSEVDLNNLSPMQAFLLVSDLVEKVNK